MSKEHKIKIWPSYFEAIKTGAKTFEWRKNDRDYAVGDTLLLREYKPDAEFRGPDSLNYTGRELSALITYKAEGVFGMPEGFCVLAIRVEPKHD